VATYWPEFAANSKEDIEVRHILSHTSGVSGWEQPFTVEDMYDWEKSTAQLAAQAPWWKPGTVSGYHAQNQGHLVGELIRRVTGKSLKEFVATDIAGPLGADFQIGAKESDWDRVSDLVPPPAQNRDLTALDNNSPMFKTFTGPMLDPLAANTPAWRRADMGAVNGHSNACSLVRILSVISLGGEAAGVRLLSQKTIDAIFQEQANGIDLVAGMPLRWGIGYALPQLETFPFIPDEQICFWGGWGGSIVLMNLDRGMTIGYVMNKMGPEVLGSRRTEAYLRAVHSCLGN
jgi:CubicO group peptidase (beta-lactamase class C family)